MSFCSELSAKLDVIIDLLGSLQVASDGGTFIPSGDYDLTGSGDVPQPVIDAGYATGVSDWAGYNAYKCMAAHAMIDGIKVAVLAMDEPIDQGFALYEVFLEVLQWAGIGTGLITFGPITVSALVLAQLVLAAKDPLLDEMQDIASDLETRRDELVCAMSQADGIANVAERYNGVIDTYWSGVTATFLKSLNINYLAETYFMGAYGNAEAAQAMADAGYDPADYDCCEETFGSFFGVRYGTCPQISENGPLPIYGQYTFTSEYTGSVHAVQVSLTDDETPPICAGTGKWIITAHGTTGWTATSNSFRVCRRTGACVDAYDAAVGWVNSGFPKVIVNAANGNGFQLLSATAFTITISYYWQAA